MWNTAIWINFATTKQRRRRFAKPEWSFYFPRL
jgi:hypothetical protein